MAVVARGQITVRVAVDAYTLCQSVDKSAVSCDHTGKVLGTLTINSVISVRCGDTPVTDFTIGAILKPVGFNSVVVNQATKTVTYSILGGDTSLADTGAISVPVVINGQTFTATFSWFKVREGKPGNADISLPDWITDWDSGKTVIDSQSVVTPKIFVGTKNTDGTITGTALGRFVLNTRNASGPIILETINGIYGFCDGRKTFAIDSTGNVQLGNGSEYIRYNAATGKVEFGSAVALAWIGSTYIDAGGVFTGRLSAAAVDAVRLDASQITAGKLSAERIDVAALKSELITAGNIEALTLNVSQGKIGGWTIDKTCIYRGTKTDIGLKFTPDMSSMTIGLAGIRGKMWRLDSIGTGSLAGGNIWWDLLGNVHFEQSVSVQWQAGIDAAGELARAMAFGKMLYRDPTFGSGTNGIKSYNNSANENVTFARIADPQAPNDSHQVLEISTAGEAAPGHGGFYFGNMSAPDKIFITRIIARIPAGYRFAFASNSIGTGGFGKCLTSTEGTGKWEEYIFKVTCGSEGTFSSTNFFYLETNPDAVLPVVWQVAYATIFDVTSCEKYVTTIDADGVYTGKLTAGQVTTGYLSADRIAAGSIKAEKLDAASIKAGIINTDYINGLSCTFTKGTIGGWTIGADNITSGTVGTVGTTPIQIRSAAAGSGYWYNGSYRPYGVIQTWHQSGNAGHIVFGQVAANGSSLKTGFAGIQMMSWDSMEYFCLSANTQLSGSKEIYNRIAGWGFDHQRIWKNSVSLGTDGSITNGTRWKLNNDGSGQIAGGNISWNAGGAVTFSTSVSLNWTSGITNLTNALGGASYPKLTYINSTGIYTGTLTAAQINAVAISASSITTGTLSAERIAAGSIKAEKLDAASIKTGIVNTDYINGLTLKFDKGIIGGWTINSGSIYSSTGNITLDHTNNRIAVFASGASSVNGARVVLHYTSATSYGLQVLNAANAVLVNLGYANSIAGWNITPSYLNRNTVYLGASGSIYNASYWRFNGDGSGQIASGNISWTAAGAVTFAASVSVAWTTPINNITTALGGSSFPKMTYISSSGIYTGTVYANQIAVNTALVVGGSTYNGSISVRDASNNTKVTLNRNGITAVGGTIGGWNLSASQIYSGTVTLSSGGSIANGTKWRLNADGSGQLAGGHLSWDTAGNLSATGGNFKDVTIQGTIRSAFVLNDPSIWIGGSDVSQVDPRHYDNVVVVRGSWNENINLQWTLDQSGRRVCLLNYMWHNTLSVGYMDLTAPSGKWFFEDGIKKSKISFSRELVELLGYGDDKTFFGWIVINRRDVGCDYRYGFYQQVLAHGVVTCNSTTSASIKYKTFDGLTMSVSKSGTGNFYVYMPWSLGADKYMVMLSGRTSTVQNTMIYASIRNQYSSYFQVSTQDDASTNDGSFNFQIISTADYK